jgi:SAM-dependent methyltransferase
MRTHVPKAEDYSSDFYDFSSYVDRRRMLTYWHQLKTVLAMKPGSVLEVGVGPGLVTAYLRSLGIAVTTVDVNADLRPDMVMSVLDLADQFERQQFDVVLCARVLHHLPVDAFGEALRNVTEVAARGAVVVLPREDSAVYVGYRYPSSDIRFKRIAMPKVARSAALRARGIARDPNRDNSQWSVGAGLSTDEIAAVARALGVRARQFGLPEDSSHHFVILER